MQQSTKFKIFAVLFSISGHTQICTLTKFSGGGLLHPHPHPPTHGECLLPLVYDPRAVTGRSDE